VTIRYASSDRHRLAKRNTEIKPNGKLLWAGFRAIVCKVVLAPEGAVVSDVDANPLGRTCPKQSVYVEDLVAFYLFKKVALMSIC
jgi:hypothetical protein